MEAISAAMADIRGGWVLDVATGRGGFVPALQELLGDYERIIGVDANLHALAQARTHIADGNVHFLPMTAERLGFADGRLQTVAMANSLHHMTDPQQTLTEMKRVLAPGGHFILREMVCDGQTETQRTNVEMHHWWAAVDRAQGVPHFETFSRREIEEQVKKMGLRHVTIMEHADFTVDPWHVETHDRLHDVLTTYMVRVADLPDGPALQRRGAELCERLRRIGLQWATALVVIGQK